MLPDNDDIIGLLVDKARAAGQLPLDHVDIDIEGTKEVKKTDLVNYLRQTPNHRILGFLKLQLATYSLSGQDSTNGGTSGSGAWDSPRSSTARH